jgi:hypothetical protein
MATNYNDPNTVPGDEDHVFLTICWNGKKWPAQVSDSEDLSVLDGPVDSAEDLNLSLTNMTTPHKSRSEDLSVDRAHGVCDGALKSAKDLSVDQCLSLTNMTTPNKSRPEDLNLDECLALNVNTPQKSRAEHRTVWTRPHHKSRMDTAVTKWYNLPETPAKGLGSRGGLTRGQFAVDIGRVPPSTFRDRLKSGNALTSPTQGRPGLLTKDERRAVADSVARRDEMNSGKDTTVLITCLHQAFPTLTRKQLSNHWHHTLKKDEVLTKGRVTGEASSIARSGAINEFAQRAWFLTVKRIRTNLDALSPGTYEGKTYQELRNHFIVGSDEEGVQASYNGKRLVGRRGKKLHMFNSADSRTSATALRTGSAASKKGPSMYILGGQKAEIYIDTKFLVENGAPEGSIYTCNPAAYMTDSTWDANVDDFCRALRNMDPVVQANPNWWMEWHVDGFKSKVNTAHGQPNNTLCYRPIVLPCITLVLISTCTNDPNNTQCHTHTQVSKPSTNGRLPQYNHLPTQATLTK